VFIKPMKHHLLATAAAVCLSACAGTKVTNTVIAAGATSPKTISVRPFNIADGAYRGSHGGAALRTIRESQAPAAFAQILKGELEKIAPTAVLADDETAEAGWVVDGDIELINAGNPWGRAIAGGVGLGRSGILLHVRVTEVGSNRRSDEKGGHGPVVFEFDVAGGSRLMGHVGTVRSSGLGYAVPFDMRNAAEKIRQTLETDGDRYGLRESALR
jgi:hypothetical protein